MNLNYNFIVNPITNRKVSIFSNLGKKIISNYIKSHQSGGYVKKRDSDDLEYLENINRHGGSNNDTQSNYDNSLYTEIPGYQDGGYDSMSNSYEYIRPGVRVLSPKTHNEYIKSGRKSVSQSGGSDNFEWKSAKVINNESDYINMKNSKVDKLLMIYAPWCGHCVSTKPIFDMVAENNDDRNKEYYVLDGDNDVIKNILDKNDIDIMFYPSLKKMLRSNNNNITDYNDTRNEYDFTHFNE